jgi:hypothetical protein
MRARAVKSNVEKISLRISLANYAQASSSKMMRLIHWSVVVERLQAVLRIEVSEKKPPLLAAKGQAAVKYGEMHLQT